MNRRVPNGTHGGVRGRGFNKSPPTRFSLEEVDGINDKLKEIIYQTQKSVDEDELTFKQSIAKSKECYVLLRVVRKIAKEKDKCEKQAIDNEFAIELDKDELKLIKGLFAEMFK